MISFLLSVSVLPERMNSRHLTEKGYTILLIHMKENADLFKSA